VSDIVIICHPYGHFSVWKDPGTGHGSPILETRQEADARAKVLQDEAGGPEMAPIVVRDLRPNPNVRGRRAGLPVRSA